MINKTHLIVFITLYTTVILLRLWQNYRSFDVVWLWKITRGDIKTKIILLIVIILVVTLLISILVNIFKIVPTGLP